MILYVKGERKNEGLYAKCRLAILPIYSEDDNVALVDLDEEETGDRFISSVANGDVMTWDEYCDLVKEYIYHSEAHGFEPTEYGVLHEPLDDPDDLDYFYTADEIERRA